MLRKTKNDNRELVVRAANRQGEAFLLHRSMEGVYWQWSEVCE